MSGHLLQEGDVVRARTAAGIWVIVELHLVRGEADCRRAYGGIKSTRTFPTSDLTPVEVRLHD